MMDSNFYTLKHARRVTPKFEQRTKYLADTLATLQEYHKRANAKKQRTLIEVLGRAVRVQFRVAVETDAITHY